jgi:CelD/BcsL family acetyltransferase involved in cellulose biosynthesis
MLRAETVHPADLDPADAASWRALCAAQPEFYSPLLGPDFTLAVARVRKDVRVAIWRNQGKPVAFLPHHHRPGGFARPVGAPLSDYHALVAERGFDVPRALAEANIAAFRFVSLVDPQGAFATQSTTERQAYRIALETTAEAYLEALRAASAKRFKNYRRLDHKLDREVGELRVVAPDDSREAFDTLLTWKRDQLVRTNALNFLRPTWTRDLLSALFEMKTGDFRGLMVNLYAGERLVGGHFGVRMGSIYHPWIASMDPELAAWSPGQIFLSRAISAMPELGLTIYDLGPGHEHYKKPYALTSHPVFEGLAAAESMGGRAARASDRAWTLVGSERWETMNLVRRRLDAIATLEQSLAGRAASLASAVMSHTLRRGATEEAA